MIASVADTLATHPVLLLFVTVVLGLLIGSVRVGGFSLGVAAVRLPGSQSAPSTTLRLTPAFTHSPDHEDPDRSSP